jgi:hypothetical protein
MSIGIGNLVILGIEKALERIRSIRGELADGLIIEIGADFTRDEQRWPMSPPACARTSCQDM